MKNLIWIIIISAALSSCSKGTNRVPGANLNGIVQTLYSKQPCAAVIPESWVASWPLPTGAKSGKEFKLLYYPVTRQGHDIKLSAPLGEAVFTTKGGSPSSCRRLPGEPKELAGNSLSIAASHFSVEELEAHSARLYALSEKTAAIFAAGNPPAKEQRPMLREYGQLFLELAEPPLLPYYYRLQPEFWGWLKAAGAPSLPAT
ncbi:MAG: hypothetical protein Q9M27_00605 [Mariprofundaceae bacterium]|nr:hypothetical protein [Mariprofundaceae bacterium]